MATTNQHGAAV